MKNKKYISIALLLSIVLHNNINSMGKESEYNNTNNGLSQIGNTPYELLQVFYEDVLGRTINDLRDISVESIKEMKKNIQIGISGMPMLSNHINKNLKYDKDYIRKLVTSLIQERLSYLIERDKKDYQGKYKGFSQDALNIKLILSAFLSDFDDALQLILAGADVNNIDDYSNNALDWAVFRNHNKEIVELLIAAGTDLNNIQNSSSGTALMHAIMHERADIVRLLIDSGADVNAINKDGSTALMLVATTRRYRIDIDIDIVRLLIKAGANINLKDNYGKTVLMQALSIKSEKIKKIVNLLILLGADVNVKDNQGRTALMIAKKYGHKDIVNLLKDADTRD